MCGVSTGLPGFSLPDDKGNWSGFDVDVCRAIAAAIFNDPAKVRFVPLDSNERFTETRVSVASAVISARRSPLAMRASILTSCLSNFFLA